MKLPTPEISIIMATYNRAHFISEALTSIVEQSFQNWECLIIDDGSTDNTEHIVQNYQKRDSRFIYYKRKLPYTKGISGCRNYGITLAQGDYIIFFDDDDITHPLNLETCVLHLKASEKDFCHYSKKSFTCELPEIINPNHPVGTYQEITRNQVESFLMNRISIASCTVMWRKDCFRNNLFNEELKYAEELEGYFRILLSGAEGIEIEDVLYYNRKHDISNTGRFWKQDPEKRRSYTQALKLIISRLGKEDLLTPILERHFVQMGIFVKDYSIIEAVLEASEKPFYSGWKFRLFYIFYPYIIIGYKAKKMIKNKIS